MKRSHSKLITTIILVFVLTFSLVSSCSAAQKVEVVNDGSQLILNINNRQIMGDQPPYIANNCTLVPISVVAQELGANAEWNQSAQTVTINKGKQIVL
ncbi:MAG: stalk domain-containing protein, partial [Methanobacterium sp.]